MKIYTRTGDAGTTALFGGDRVRKDHPRITAYGTVDETNSLVGLVRAHLHEAPGRDRLDPVLGTIQNDLFVLGADLATPLGARPVVPRLEAAHIEHLEHTIDAFEEDLPALKHFVLPGAPPPPATLHLARTTCRRAERLVIHLAERAGAEEELNEHVQRYLNRLSDLFFVLARWANHAAGTREEEWVKGGMGERGNG